MRNLSLFLMSNSKSKVASLATCRKINRQDRIVLGFTNHNRKITLESIEYDLIAGFSATNVEISRNMAMSNLELARQFYLTKIKEAELLAG